MEKMFCFQCEQTAGHSACTGLAGVCGKSEAVARLQDELTGALIGLARAASGSSSKKTACKVIISGLFTTITNVNFNSETVKEQINAAKLEKAAINADSPDYDMQLLWSENEDIRSLKSLILFGLRGVAAYAYHAMNLGYEDREVNGFFIKGLAAVGQNLGMEDLLPIVLEVGRINLKCMELLDRANTETYGNPVPTAVPLTVEKGPFIVITGHDLHDLKLLLEQTKGKGIDIYTHGEMLPAHSYPLLKQYPQLKGNFGTAWQNQQKEFNNLPAP
ncbi:MAG: hydroxylamine reductase, partial [Bacillota bacterium]|nr:hydroxylamine reductase [Bacillota bacterium]